LSFDENCIFTYAYRHLTKDDAENAVRLLETLKPEDTISFSTRSGSTTSYMKFHNGYAEEGGLTGVFANSKTALTIKFNVEWNGPHIALKPQTFTYGLINSYSTLHLHKYANGGLGLCSYVLHRLDYKAQLTRCNNVDPEGDKRFWFSAYCPDCVGDDWDSNKDKTWLFRDFEMQLMDIHDMKRQLQVTSGRSWLDGSSGSPDQEQKFLLAKNLKLYVKDETK